MTDWCAKIDTTRPTLEDGDIKYKLLSDKWTENAMVELLDFMINDELGGDDD